MKIAKEMIAEHTPKEYLNRLDKLPNDALLFLSMTMKSVHDKYVKEDGIVKPGAGSGTGDVNALRAQARQLMESAAYKDFRDPQHDAVTKQVSELYQKIAGFEVPEKKD